jgi:hypothetical protein
MGSPSSCIVLKRRIDRLQKRGLAQGLVEALDGAAFKQAWDDGLSAFLPALAHQPLVKVAGRARPTQRSSAFGPLTKRLPRA